MIILAPEPRIEVKICSMDYLEFALKKNEKNVTYLLLNCPTKIIDADEVPKEQRINDRMSTAWLSRKEKASRSSVYAFSHSTNLE